MQPRLISIATTALLLLLVPEAGRALVTDARRSGMGGVLLPGRDLSAANPAFHGLEFPRTGRSIPLPLGVVAGLAADTEGQDDFEKAVTRLKAAYPFFEVELRPEPDLSDDIVIEVAKDQLRIDLGKGSAAVPAEGVTADFLSRGGILTVSPGPVFVTLSTLMYTNGKLDLDDPLKDALRGGEPFEANAVYRAWGDGEGAAALTLTLGSTIRLGGAVPGPDAGWGFHAGGGIKGYMGLGYADTHLDADLTTGDPIFDPDDPLDVTYVADLRYSRGLGWGVGLDLGVCAVQGPWLAGLSVENLGATLTWKTDRRIEELTADGDVLSTQVARDETHKAKVPVVWTANGAWVTEAWLVAADLRLQQSHLGVHAGCERRFGLLAARGGLSWNEQGGIQGAIGGGIGLGGWRFDVSLRTHPYLYSDGRGLFLGASVGVPL